MRDREISLKLAGERNGSKLTIVRISVSTDVKVCLMF